MKFNPTPARRSRFGFGLSLVTSALVLVFLTAVARAQPGWHPGHYMTTTYHDDSADPVHILNPMIDQLALPSHANVKGIKVFWYWRDIESDAGGTYNWAAIEDALHRCALIQKQLVVEIDDRSFKGGTETEARRVLPAYLIDTPIYGNPPSLGYYPISSGTGVAARIYLPAVADRYIAMMKDMAAHFSTNPDLPYLEAVYAGPGESVHGAVPVPTDLNYSDANFVAQRKRIGVEMVAVWPNTTVIQPFNFIPGSSSAYPAFMQHIEANRLATGGPDIFANKGTLLDDLTTGQETFVGLYGGVDARDYRGEVAAMFDVQWPDFTQYGTPRPIPAEIFKRAYETLRCSHIFWNRMTSGTSAQNWTTGILPFIDSIGGLTHTGKPINYGGGLPRAVECEAFDFVASPSSFDIRTNPRDVLFKALAVGDTIVFPVPYLPAGTYNIDVVVQKGPNRGIFQLASDTVINGAYTATHGSTQDTQDANYLTTTIPVATGVSITSTGTRYFRFRVTGKTGTGYYLGLDRIILTPITAPEADVKFGSTAIADGDVSPSTAEGTDFGSAAVNTGDVQKTYTIQNSGSGPLMVGSVVAGSDFSLAIPPSSTVPGSNGTTTFTLHFFPKTAGDRTATVRFLNSDTSESVYDFAIKGTATDAGLRAWLKLDQSSGTSATDSSGNGATGTLQGSPVPTWVAGKLNNGVDLAGTNQYIDLSDTGMSNFSSGITLSLWVKPEGLAANANNARFIELGNGPSTSNIIFCRYGTTDGLRLKVYNSGGSVGDIVASGAIEQDVWQRFTATITAAGVVVLYKNGIPLATTGSLSAGPETGTRTWNYVGKSNWSDPYLDGKVDDVRIYNRVLTVEEIALLP